MKEEKPKKEKKSKHSKKEKKSSHHKERDRDRDKHKKSSMEDHKHHHDDRHHKKVKRSQDENEITSEDYFTKSEEFRVWLKLSKHRSFEELDTNVAQELFLEFCDLWNTQALPEMYYIGSFSLSIDLRHLIARRPQGSHQKFAMNVFERNTSSHLSLHISIIFLDLYSDGDSAYQHLKKSRSSRPSVRRSCG
jgi:hypothetical protein